MKSVRSASCVFQKPRGYLTIVGYSVSGCSVDGAFIRTHYRAMSHIHSHKLGRNRPTAIHQRDVSLPCKLTSRCRNIKGDSHRCFSGEGKDDIDNDAIDFDRSKFNREVTIQMPDVGDDMEGVIERWYMKEGDVIKSGDAICDIKTEVIFLSV